jgi:hypothetical protein
MAPNRILLHLNVGLASTDNYQADIEIVTFLQDDKDIPAEEIFKFHDLLPGRTGVERSATESLISMPNFVDESLSAESGGLFRPALLPAAPDYAGYIHADLWNRMPYIPTNFSKDGRLLYAHPREGGLDVALDDAVCGELSLWNDRWSPVHHKDLGSRFGVGLTMNSDLSRA